MDSLTALSPMHSLEVLICYEADRYDKDSPFIDHTVKGRNGSVFIKQGLASVQSISNTTATPSCGSA